MSQAVPSLTGAVSNQPPEQYSRRLLRYVATEHDLFPGSRVLELGCGQGELTRHLHRLSMEVTAYERDAASLKTAMATLPDVEFHHWKTDLQRFGEEGHYDLVIAHGNAYLDGDLFSESTLKWTAHLAGCLRPGGALIFLVRHDPQQLKTPVGHLPSCYTRLFSRFPGTTTQIMIADPLNDPRTWDWMLGRRPRSGQLAVSLHLPKQPLSRFEWHQWAAQEISRPQVPCCAWARRQVVSDTPIRRAA